LKPKINVRDQMCGLAKNKVSFEIK
jgi:hypothetical protein